jgi:hypothetical protein
MSSCLHVSSIVPFSCLPATNRAGAVPVLGTLVGIVRVVASLIVLLLASIMFCIEWIKTGETRRESDLLKISIVEFGLGLAEMVPGLGTMVHILLDMSCNVEYLKF